jgi:branched-subunit amino acid permease
MKKMWTYGLAAIVVIILIYVVLAYMGYVPAFW